ncbi:serine proteinase stubble isoform X2 [Pseudomyrmex gracilis]|uniref:serine proteinase stubble isoform X2 n=1 Tax=Pseudomyrmex gracilis TaxID=219809 RepID=UPI0009952BBB|nr:serine proteinase stubble isoform X2 [Pseudomyrmex gracilis]
MCDRRKSAWAAIFISNVLIHSVVIASPIYIPQFMPGSTGRNIRHLPCVSRRSGETGVCMFAFTCAKANGTHLGTCIDRFYFGSCCKIDDEPDIFSQDNSIDDGPSPSRPFVTTHGPIESNDIPEYFARPKPTGDEKKPAEAPQTTTTSIVSSTQSTQTSASTLRDTTKFVTKKPTITTIETTTQTTRLSTFQTVQSASNSGSSTETVWLKNVTGTVNRPSSTSSSTTRQPTKPFTMSSLRPNIENVTKLAIANNITTQKESTKRPVVVSTTQRLTTTQTSHKPISLTTHRPIQSTTTKTVFTTHKVVPSTRFPPRNSTTVKPLTQTTTRKPVSGTKRPTVITKRPIVTTKKPTTLTKRPSTSSPITKPITSSSFGTTLPATTKPYSTFGSLSSVELSNTNVILESTLASVEPSTATASTSVSNQKTTITKNPQDVSTTRTTTSWSTTKTTAKSTIETTTSRPTTAKITTTTSKTTTSRPLQSTTTRSKPTKVTSTTTRPEYITITTERTRPSSTVGTTIGSTRPKPTQPKPTTKPTQLLTKLPMNTSSIVEVTTSISSSISTFTVRNESTSTHVPPTKGQNVNHTLEEIPVTTHSPGLVTWSSNSDEITKLSSSTSTTITSSEQTETDWSPITTPDGWIMIQSPTTEKLPQTQESTTEPVVESTIESLTSAKPVTESTTIFDYDTQKPMKNTTPLPITGVTVDSKLPVPMETVNMSDYKQVCGRRLFPEQRYREPKIVGGSRSNFGKWPWQISLRQWRSQTYLHKCGAALLNENWAITAAHCVESVPPSDLLLRIGEHDLASEDEAYGYQERRVQIVASHPQFDARTFEYDLALLRFYEPVVPFQPNILPICLPDDDETYVGRTAFVTGWGRLYDEDQLVSPVKFLEGPLPSVLQEVAVPVINNTVCEAMYKNAGFEEHIPHIFICAGWKNGGFDSCEGDSGGPMVIQRPKDNRWILAGIISWGIGCAAPNQPGVYTRISEFRDWINQILQF